MVEFDSGEGGRTRVLEAGEGERAESLKESGVKPTPSRGDEDLSDPSNSSATSTNASRRMAGAGGGIDPGEADEVKLEQMVSFKYSTKTL